VIAVIASSDLDFAIDAQGALEGYDVYHLDTAEQALYDTHRLEPNVVIVHETLRGGVSSSEVAGLLSRRAELRQSWVMGVAPLDQISAFYQQGVADVEPEPFDAERFKARLEVTLRSKQIQTLAYQRFDQLEQKYAALLEDERLRDRLTHMLVHDLKNPIGSVMGAIDYVRADAQQFLPTSHQELIEMAYEQSQRLLQLASNILEVRKMREGKLRLEPRILAPADLREIISGAVADVGVQTKERRLKARVKDDLPLFAADADLLRRVLANLISNAIKHTEVGGRIRMETRVDGAFIEITVQDDGEGIPQEDLERIFQDFERSRLTNTTRFDTGMGLAFCKLAVEQHGGRIWVHSVRGRGSNFFFTLPLGIPELDDEVELVD
jgi:signal transduction histidine kinase